MQAKTKKWIAGIAIATSVMLIIGWGIYCIVGIVSCKKGLENRIKQTEDFYYAYYSYDGEMRVGIKGFTKVGASKEMLVIPEEINGYPVGRLFDSFGLQTDSQLYSVSLKKLYVPNASANYNTFEGCSSLEKIIFYQRDAGYHSYGGGRAEK